MNVPLAETDKNQILFSALKKGQILEDGYIFMCRICEKEIQYVQEMQSHSKLHTTELPFLCAVCFERFPSKLHLSTHSLFHNKMEILCNRCNKSFKNGAKFATHSKLVHTINGAKPFKCSVCAGEFQLFLSLKQHFNSQHSNFKKIIKKDLVQCYTCNKSFTSEKKIDINMYLREGEDPFKCNTCPSVFVCVKKYEEINENPVLNFYCSSCLDFFKSKKQMIGCNSFNTDLTSYKCKACMHFFRNDACLKSHNCFNGNAKSETKPELFHCEMCSHPLSNLHYLKKHMKKHLREKVYKCHVCSKTFFSMAYLKRHLRSHTGEKPFVCNTCQKAFSIKYNLNVHERIHTGEKPFSCDVCHQTFRVKSILKEHSRIHDK